MRLSFMLGDHVPTLLIQGRADDFRALAGVLRYFASDPIDTRVDRLTSRRPGGAPLTIALASGWCGMRRHPADPDAFLWLLDPDRALGFANLVESLADPDRPSGSALLSCGTDGEIQVRISREDHTDGAAVSAR